MKKISIDSKSIINVLPITSDEDADLKWTFLNIYNLRELKDSYLIVLQNQGKSVKELCEYISLYVTPEKKSWDGGKKKGRKALEPLTALKKFGLISSDHKIIKLIFKESILNAPLTEIDKKDLKEIFFDYVRFRELSTWLVDPSSSNNKKIVSEISETYVQLNSKPIFYFADENRFYDTFMYELNEKPNIYKIPSKSTHLMRFWEVFIKWGTFLSVLEKFSLEHSDYKIEYSENLSKPKSLSCVYFLSGKKENIDVINFAKNYFKSKRIYLPELILQICLYFRISVEEAKDIVINQGRKHKDFIGFERTSEIFVKIKDFKKKQKETIFFPKFQDSYISHLNLK